MLNVKKDLRGVECVGDAKLYCDLNSAAYAMHEAVALGKLKKGAAAADRVTEVATEILSDGGINKRCASSWTQEERQWLAASAGSGSGSGSDTFNAVDPILRYLPNTTLEWSKEQELRARAAAVVAHQEALSAALSSRCADTLRLATDKVWI